MILINDLNFPLMMLLGHEMSVGFFFCYLSLKFLYEMGNVTFWVICFMFGVFTSK